MKLRRTHIVRQAAVVTLLSAVFMGSAWTAGPVARADAANWEIFDQGEHLQLPEGPIEENGALMVPLRPIAERWLASVSKLVKVGGKNVERTGYIDRKGR